MFLFQTGCRIGEIDASDHPESADNDEERRKWPEFR